MLSFQIKPAVNGEFYVVQIGKNGEPLNTSQMLSSHANALGNISAVVCNVNTKEQTKFKVVDLSKRDQFHVIVENGNCRIWKHPRPLNKTQLAKYGL